MANKNYSDMKPDELMHYGRKGMKWGQNIFGKKETKMGRKISSSSSGLESDGTTSDGIRVFKNGPKGWTKEFLSKERDEPTKEDIQKRQKEYADIAKEYGFEQKTLSAREAKNHFYERRSSDLVFVAGDYARHGYIKDAEKIFNRAKESAKKISDKEQYDDYIHSDHWLEGFWDYEFAMEAYGKRVTGLKHSGLRDDELMHYGRKGMKWYQNIFTSGKKSGSKKRGDSDDDAGTPTKAKTKSSSTTKKKSVKEMSDTELSDAIRRLEMERRYRELTPQQVSKGKAFTNSVVNKMILPAAEDVGRQLVKTFLVDQVNKGFGFDDEEHKVYTNNKKKK